jgi:hypothetical protein
VNICKTVGAYTGSVMTFFQEEKNEKDSWNNYCRYYYLFAGREQGIPLKAGVRTQQGT